MSQKKSTTLYRNFFREAWSLTWKRKSLWIFGIFAALVSTGGVIDVVWRALERTEKTESLLENLMDASFIGYNVAGSYIRQISILGSSRVSFIVIALTLMGVLLLVMAIVSQGALVHGIRNKKKVDPYNLQHAGSAHFWSLFVLAFLNKVLMLMLVVLMALPLWLVSVSYSTLHVATFFVLMLLFIPAAIIVNIIYMFAVIDVVETKDHALNAIHTGIDLFMKQWLASLEYGVMLFFLVFGAGFLLVAALAALLVPYAVLFTSALLTGSYTVFITVNILAFFVFIGIIMIFGGACVTFQYSSWYQFYKRALHKTHGKKVFSKIIRIAHR